MQYIIDSVISELSLDPDKRFIQVETGFFWLWWNEQDEDTREVARQLVREGRLEIAGGGWSMADEASTHYSSFVDNIGLGLNTLKDALGLKTAKHTLSICSINYFCRHMCFTPCGLAG